MGEGGKKKRITKAKQKKKREKKREGKRLL